MRLRVHAITIGIGVLLVLLAQRSTAQQLPSLPVLKTKQLSRGDALRVEMEAAKAPDPAPRVELIRQEQTFDVPLTFEAPVAPAKAGIASGAIGEGTNLGEWTAYLYWGTQKYGLGSLTIQPAGGAAVHLKQIVPADTYDLEPAYVPDPSDTSAEKITVGNYAIAMDKSELPNLRINWANHGSYAALLNGCSYLPPLGSEGHAVPAPKRFYASAAKPGEIDLCNIPIGATFELLGHTEAVNASQTGPQRDMWLAAPKKSIKQQTVSVTLHGSGFQVGNPADNAIWLDGVRQMVVWDGCANNLNLGAPNEPQPVTIHAEVISSEEIHLCSILLPANGRVQLRIGYGDVQSEPKVLRTFAMGRVSVAIRAMVIALILALLPLLLLSSLQNSYRIAGSDYKWRMLFLDPETDTYSLSKLQFYLWTVAALFGYAYLFISRVRVQDAAWPDVPTSLPGIILVAGGTAVTSQIITATKGSKGSGEEQPSWSDFITSGGVVAADRLQMFLWTLFGVGAFLYAVLQLLPGTITDLPAIPDRLLVLMGISSAGYLGGKIARKAGPVISEISVTPAESDATIALKQDQGETPDLVGALTIAQQALGSVNPSANANAKTARDALDQGVRSAGAAHTSSEFNQLVADLAAKCAVAETAAAAAAADFATGKATGPDAEAAQASAAALQGLSADVMQAISLASKGPMQAEEAPPLIARTIDLRGSNLSPEALLEIDHQGLPFRMLTDKDGKNQPEIVTRDQDNATFASVLRLTINPAQLGDSDLTQFVSWFSNDGQHMLTFTNPDGQKSEISFGVPPAAAQKGNS